MTPFRVFRKIGIAIDNLRGRQLASERQVLMLGRLLALQSRSRSQITSLQDVEFSAFSQFGDDGIIQWLIAHLDIPNRTFIEFGVEDYRESNTRFLMMNDNWSGFVMDGSENYVSRIRNAEYFWRHDLGAVAAFIDRDNINELLAGSGLGPDVGLLHIDLDGNDYWIWKQIEVISPIIVILEYNSLFGAERSITVPYEPTFDRTQADSSNLYFGASLPALQRLSDSKGYAFIGCNSAGNNAYFVRRDKISEPVSETSVQDGYVLSKYRESRDPGGQLSYLRGEDRVAAIRGLPVHNVETGQIEPF